MDSNTIIEGDIITIHTSMDRSSRHNINKETGASNDTLGLIGLTDIYRRFYSKNAEYSFELHVGNSL